MNTFSYSFPTNIRFGSGIIKELAPYLKDQNLSRPLIVTDPNIAELDFIKKIIKDLKRQHLKPEIFFNIHKNPVKSDVLKGADIWHNLKCDSVIGIGGGAAMDVARAIVLRVHHYRDLFDYDDLVGGSKYITEPVPHFITVPTTAGTGSEVGRSAVISEDETRKKRILFHPKLMAKMVFADPELTYELPPFITAATGMDALAHNMEAFLAKGFNPLCDGIALEGIKLIFESLENAVNQPNPGSRSKMMIASLMGAVAFQKGLGVVHSLAHPLSTMLDMHHGLAVAINLPYGMKFNISGQETKFKRIAYSMGLAQLNGEAVVNALFELNQTIGLFAKLGELCVKSEHVEQLADLAADDFCHQDNPREVKREDFKQLYLDAL